jgi:hypothetical protein
LENPKISQIPNSNPVTKVQFPKSKNYPTWKELCRIGKLLLFRQLTYPCA